MKDIIVGCITNYTFDKIETWVNSLDRCGFDGIKVMICYNVGFDVVEKLNARGYKVFGFNKNDTLKKLEYNKNPFNICVDRFIHIPYFLKMLPKDDYRYVIATDVKDVIFQSNPSLWIEQNIGHKKLNVASESLRYINEVWGNNNLRLSFGDYFYERNKNNEIFNAGTISGCFKEFCDLCENIYLLCQGSPMFVPGGGGPDQAALNVLLNLEPYKSITNFAKSEDGYAAQLGTTSDPSKIQAFRQFLLESEPKFDDKNCLVTTSTGKPFSIVHQYDRVPQWKSLIEGKYA